MMNLVEIGSGVPVLALHGWSVDHRLMLGCLEPVFARAQGYRRLYVDLPGMGKSPAPPSIASSDDLLAALLEVVAESIGDQSFLLVGESFGGYLARGLTRALPGQVLGLALICPVGPYVRPADRTVPAHEILRPDPDLVAALDARTAAMFEEISVVQTPETLRRFREEVMPGIDAADPIALTRIARSRTLTDDPEAGPPFTGPTLFLTGRQDSDVGYADQFALLQHYPRASYAALDLAGHNLQIDQPELFTALVLEWLIRVAGEH